MMRKDLLSKSLAMGVVVLFIGAVFIPYVSGNIRQNSENLCIQGNEKSSTTTDWWPMLHHDPQHTGFSTSLEPEVTKLLWSFRFVGDSSESPSIVDNKVFLSCDKKYGNSVLFCLDANKGSKKWSFEPANIWSNPAVVDGRVYFGSTDKNVYCLDILDGSLIWSYTTGNEVTTAPTVVDGKVYVISFTDKLYCLDADNGDFIWSFSDSYFTGGSSPAVWDGKVYFGAFNGMIRCLDASDGSSIWQYSASSEVESSPTIVNGRVYISSYYHMHCLDANNGNLKWKYPAPNNYFIYGCSAVANNRIYFSIGSFENSKLVCLDASNGALKWMFNNGGYSPIVADERVFFGGNKLYCADASTGALIWSYDEINDFVGSPAIADGKIYFGTGEGDNKFYTIGKGKGKDTSDEVSILSDSVSITMPRNKAISNSLLLWFLERFPILERLLNILRWNIG